MSGFCCQFVRDDGILSPFERFHCSQRLVFILRLFIVPDSLSCSLPFVSVETKPDGYRVGKELVILLFEYVVGRNVLLCFIYFLSHLVSMLVGL